MSAGFAGGSVCPGAFGRLRRRASPGRRGAIAFFAVFAACAQPANYLTAHPALPGEDRVNAIVEIPAGTSAKWEVSHSGASLDWEMKDGRPRVIRYLPYPANYGMIPRTLWGDGDPLDAVLLGPALERGSLAAGRVVGVLRLLDDDERDDKVIVVLDGGPLGDAADLADLDARYPGVTSILETWFTHYKGPGRIRSLGFGDRSDALEIVREANAAFETTGASP